MAEKDSGQERTEAPTQRQRSKARDEGKVPKSQELTGALILLAGAAALAFAGGDSIGTETLGLMGQTGDWMLIERIDVLAAYRILVSVSGTLWSAMWPFLLGVFTLALVVNGVQARGVISLSPLKPKAEHIDPMKGLGRVFSKQAVFNLVKSILKLVFLGGVSWLAFAGAWEDIVVMNTLSVPDLLDVVRTLSVRLAVFTGVAFLIVSALDYGFQVYQHEQNLKMTKHEVTQEHKETEGDPLIKSRIKALARSLSRNRMLQKVPDADVVVTNPTHIAVALKYDGASDAAPVVLAMGERKIAQRIKAAAHEAGVPIVENKPLARALFAMGKVGDAIPSTLYLAVAEVLAFVYRRRGTGTDGPRGLPEKVLA